LAHRSQPGRIFGDGPVRWKLKAVPIDLETTSSRRKWLAENLRTLSIAAEGFTLRQLTGLGQAEIKG